MPTPDMPPIPLDPFATATPPPRAAADTPVLELLRAGLIDTARTRNIRPALVLFTRLAERGPAASREACLILIEASLSSGRLGMGPAAADAYLVQVEPLDGHEPDMAAVHRATAAYLSRGRGYAADRLGLADAAAVRGAARALFCLALADLIDQDVYNQLVGDLYADAG